MKPELIETAPKDREILVYGKWGWESIDRNLSKPCWKVAKYNEYIYSCNTETFESDYIGGFSSITENPYVDYSVGIYWCELPVIEE